MYKLRVGNFLYIVDTFPGIDLNHKACPVFHFPDMPYSGSVLTYATRSSYGYHLLYHRPSNAVGLPGGEIVVAAVGGAHAELAGRGKAGLQPDYTVLH